MSSAPRWERERHWDLMRPFVYYLLETFVAPHEVAGKRVVDFSAGLGDLTRYLAAHGPEQLIATVPEDDMGAPEWLPPGTEWRAGVPASRIAESFDRGSVDVFCARMVLQFPTKEDDHVDVDDMLVQLRDVLAPGGRVVVASHSYFPMQVVPSLEFERDAGALLDRLHTLAVDSIAAAATELHRTAARRILGLVEMVRYLGLPPRLGVAGDTGFGLKGAMLSDSFVQAGYAVDVIEDVEIFTYPLGMWDRIQTDRDGVAELGQRFFEVKQRYLTSLAAGSKYDRPRVLRAMRRELDAIAEFVWVPIVRIVGHRP